MEEHPNEKLFFEEVSKHNFRIISVKKDYMQSRLKLEHSMVLFFAFDVYDTIQENSHWLFFLDELKEAFSKYLEIVLFTNNADKKLVEALLQEGENDISHIDYPRAILCHTHLNDPIVLNEFEPFDIYKTIEQWDQFYKEEFPIEKEKKFQQIRNLLNSYPVVIFIKGSPHDPFCKFSKSFIEIIRETGIRYKSFDIFKDDSLRCYLRLYSGWKTYPQFYVNGKVIGGLDVLKQLVASGEIDQVIPFECTKEATSVRIQEILKNNVLVTFSKGTLENKKCKSSNEVFEIFDKLGLKYTCFDVLTDEQARDYLKESYNYPYFPQIVYHFNLLGGVKFLKEKVTKGTIFEHVSFFLILRLLYHPINSL